MADRTISVKLKADIDKYLADLRRAGKGTEDLGKRIDSAGKKSLITLAALPAAAATAGAATAAALGGVSAAFIGIGAVALRNNTEVRQSFEDLSNTINTGIAQDAAPLADAFVGAADDIGAAYQRMRPELQRAFEASVPYVEDLTAGVTGFAENAMPGMVTAVERAGPAVDGLRTLMEETGTATGEFFSILSEHSAEAGTSVEHLGSLVSGVLPNIAELIGSLTDAWADHGDQVAEVLTQLTGVIADLSNSALPTMSDAVGVALNVLSGMLDVIEPISGALGPLIGTVLSFTAAMKAVRAVRGVFGTVAASATDLRGRLSKLDRTAAGVGVAFAGMQGIGRTINEVFGDDSTSHVDALGDSLVEFARTGKVSGEAARVLGSDMSDLDDAFWALTGWDVGIREFTQSLGGGFEDISRSVAGGKKTLGEVDDALAALVQNGQGDKAAEVFHSLAAKAREAGMPIKDLRELLPDYSAAQDTATDSTESAAEAMFGAVPGADALTDAMNTLADKTGATADHVDALNTAWEQLFGIQVTLEEAVSDFNGDLATIGDTISGAKEDTDNWRGALIKANGQINTTTEVGRTLLDNLVSQRKSYLRVAQTAYDTAIKQGKSQKQATQAAREAVNTRKAKFIEEMVQLGLTEGAANRLFDRYVGTQDLGDIVNAIRQPGMAAARSNARGYMADLNALDGKVVSSYVNIIKKIITTEDTSGGGGGTFPLPPTGATGGLVTESDIIPGFPGGGRVRGPGGPTDDRVPAMLSNGEFVVNARATDQNLELLRAINSGAFRGAPQVAGNAGPSAASTGRVHVDNLNLSAYSDRFSTKQVMDDLALHGVT